VAVVLDMHSRKIVDWAMASARSAALVCAALQVSIVQRNPTFELIVHRDVGRAMRQHPTSGGAGQESPGGQREAQEQLSGKSQNKRRHEAVFTESKNGSWLAEGLCQSCRSNKRYC
jgi:hypothetical protein